MEGLDDDFDRVLRVLPVLRTGDAEYPRNVASVGIPPDSLGKSLVQLVKSLGVLGPLQEPIGMKSVPLEHHDRWSQGELPKSSSGFLLSPLEVLEVDIGPHG